MDLIRLSMVLVQMISMFPNFWETGHGERCPWRGSNPRTLWNWCFCWHINTLAQSAIDGSINKNKVFNWQMKTFRHVLAFILQLANGRDCIGNEHHQLYNFIEHIICGHFTDRVNCSIVLLSFLASFFFWNFTEQFQWQRVIFLVLHVDQLFLDLVSSNTFKCQRLKIVVAILCKGLRPYRQSRTVEVKFLHFNVHLSQRSA